MGLIVGLRCCPPLPRRLQRGPALCACACPPTGWLGSLAHRADGVPPPRAGSHGPRSRTASLRTPIIKPSTAQAQRAHAAVWLPRRRRRRERLLRLRYATARHRWLAEQPRSSRHPARSQLARAGGCSLRESDRRRQIGSYQPPNNPIAGGMKSAPTPVNCASKSCSL